jgi:hypothetical protein
MVDKTGLNLRSLDETLQDLFTQHNSGEAADPERVEE